MDKTTLPGFMLALIALLGGAFMEGTTPDKLIMLPAFIIVFGGTVGAAMISFPLQVTTSIPKFFTILIKDVKHDLTHVVDTFVNLADRARREGLLALEQEAELARAVHPPRHPDGGGRERSGPGSRDPGS